MDERITPYRDGMSVEDRIDEIVSQGRNVHFEMMDGNYAFMIVGGDVFYLIARGSKLTCRWHEFREGYGAEPIPQKTEKW